MTKKDLELNNRRKMNDEDELIDAKDPYDVDESWWWVFQNPLGIILALGLIVILLIGVWFMFQPSSYTPPNASDLIVVKPDKGPYKELPDPETNTKVDNQDKEVYKRLNSNSNKVELKSNTVPKDKEKPVDLNKTDLSKNTKVVIEQKKEPAKQQKTDLKVVEKAPINIANVTVKKPEDLPKKKVEDAEVKPLNAQQNKLNSGSYVIRVASFKKQVTAERELSRLFNVLGKSLSGVGKSISKVNNKSGAQFYVVKIGAFSSFAEAKKTSQLLKSKHFDAVIQKVKK